MKRLVVLGALIVLVNMAMAVEMDGGLTTKVTGKGEASGGEVITSADGGLTIQVNARVPNGGTGTAFAAFEGAGSNGNVSYDGKVDAFVSKSFIQGEFKAWAALGGATNINGNSYAGAQARLTGKGNFGLARAEGLASAQQNNNSAIFEGTVMANGNTSAYSSIIAASEPAPHIDNKVVPGKGFIDGFASANFGNLVASDSFAP